jgi:hypothetical protein
LRIKAHAGADYIRVTKVQRKDRKKSQHSLLNGKKQQNDETRKHEINAIQSTASSTPTNILLANLLI